MLLVEFNTFAYKVLRGVFRPKFGLFCVFLQLEQESIPGVATFGIIAPFEHGRENLRINTPPCACFCEEVWRKARLCHVAVAFYQLLRYELSLGSTERDQISSRHSLELLPEEF